MMTRTRARTCERVTAAPSGQKDAEALFEFAGIAGIAGIDPQFNQKSYGVVTVYLEVLFELGVGGGLDESSLLKIQTGLLFERSAAVRSAKNRVLEGNIKQNF